MHKKTKKERKPLTLTLSPKGRGKSSRKLPLPSGERAGVRVRLLRMALKAAKHSYSPYSHFPVGAALLTHDGKVFTGCNVENASYGLTICAERVAVASAVAAGKRKFKALAVVGGRGRAARPCGACLQVLAEFCDPDLPIFLAPLNKPDKVETVSFGTLIPHAFRLNTEN